MKNNHTNMKEEISSNNVPKCYRKKPVKVQAMHFATNNEKGPGAPCMDAIVLWINQGKRPEEWHAWHNDTDIFIDTLEGVMTANCYDYIIKGVQGEVYPCKPDIFAETYEPVD